MQYVKNYLKKITDYSKLKVIQKKLEMTVEHWD